MVLRKVHGSLFLPSSVNFVFLAIVLQFENMLQKHAPKHNYDCPKTAYNKPTRGKICRETPIRENHGTMNAIGMIRVRHGMTIAVMMNRHAGTTMLVAEITVKKATSSGADPEKK
jgi:hypothetical protein